MANQSNNMVTSVIGDFSVNEWRPAVLAHWPTDVLKRGLTNPSKSYFTEPSMTDYLVDPAHIDWASATIEHLIHLLHVPHLVQHALSYLCQKRESYDGMGILLWHSYKGVTILVEEVKSTARKLFSKNFTTTDVIRACQAITLLQCLASQRETKQVFLTAKVTDSLCLFLVDMNREEHTLVLRNASLRAISAFFEADHPVLPDAIDHFLEKNLMACFLSSMEHADLHSQWTATFIVSKILMTEEGLGYISAEAEPCFRVIRAYAAVLETLDFTSPTHLLNDIIQSYLRMIDEPRARDALKHHLPLKLGTPIFAAAVARDAGTAQKLELLLHTMSEIQRDEFAPYNNHLQAPSSRLRMIA